MLFKKTVTRRRKDGTKYSEKTRTWYTRFRHPGTGLDVEQSLCTTNKSAAKMLESEAIKRATAEAVGIVNPKRGEHLSLDLVDEDVGAERLLLSGGGP